MIDVDFKLTALKRDSHPCNGMYKSDHFKLKFPVNLAFSWNFIHGCLKCEQWPCFLQTYILKQTGLTSKQVDKKISFFQNYLQFSAKPDPKSNMGCLCFLPQIIHKLTEVSAPPQTFPIAPIPFHIFIRGGGQTSLSLPNLGKIHSYFGGKRCI